MARIIGFFDGATSETTPTIGNIIASNLVEYANDAAYEAAESGAPTTGNIYFNTTDNTVRYYDGSNWQAVGREVDVSANTQEAADIRTTTGTANGDTDMGTYTGSTISDNQSAKQNIQQLEDETEGNRTDIDINLAEAADNRTTSGTSVGDTDMGTYTGSIITDNSDQRVINQELETAIEGIPAGLTFQGNWNASTNTPTLVSSTGTSGHYYIVSVAGSTSLDGESDWNIGDWAVFTDTGVWQKIDNSESITDTDDLPEGVSNLYYTDVRADARIAAASVDDLSDVDTTSSAPGIGEALTWDGSDWVPGAPTPGPASKSIRTETADYTITDTDDVILVDAISDDITLTLPASASNSGKEYTIKRVDNATQSQSIFNDSVVNTTTDQIQMNSHQFRDLQKVQLTDGGAGLPSPLAAATDYWVIYIDVNNIQLATSAANAASDTQIDLTTTGGATVNSIISELTTVTVDGNASETIDGQTSITLVCENDVASIISDAVNWRVESLDLHPRTQTKYLTSSTSSTGTWLTFSNLTIGKWYSYNMSIRTSGTNTIQVRHNSVTLDQLVVTATGNNYSSFQFLAAATTLTFEAPTVGGNIVGGGDATGSFVQLSEIKDQTEDTIW